MKCLIPEGPQDEAKDMQATFLSHWGSKSTSWCPPLFYLVVCLIMLGALAGRSCPGLCSARPGLWLWPFPAALVLLGQKMPRSSEWASFFSQAPCPSSPCPPGFRKTRGL